jgi:NADPH:quinone reductase-like Zn-dependent oxidoreductase
VYVDSREAFPVPEPLDAGEAVASILNYVTAYQMLHRLAAVRPGDRVLVHAAGGGVGTALLELGRIAGLRLYGTASAAKHSNVAGYGAVPIDYRSADFVEVMRCCAPDGVDAVFDPIGGEHVGRSARTLGPNGRLIQYGFTSILGEQDRAALADQWRKPAQVLVGEGQAAHRYSITAWKKEHPDWFRDDVERMFDLLGQGRIKPLIAARFPLEEAARAQRLLESSAAIGKIILVP